MKSLVFSIVVVVVAVAVVDIEMLVGVIYDNYLTSDGYGIQETFNFRTFNFVTDVCRRRDELKRSHGASEPLLL